MLQPNVYASIVLQRLWGSEGEGLKLCVDGDRWSCENKGIVDFYVFIFVKNSGDFLTCFG